MGGNALEYSFSGQNSIATQRRTANPTSLCGRIESYVVIKKEVKDGWHLYSVILNGEIISAAFCKLEGEVLHSKNTSIKIQHQGSGFSHRIMEFFESRAKELKSSSIVHYCSIDNFRQYALNESHGYVKTSRKLGKLGHTTEWVKLLK